MRLISLRRPCRVLELRHATFSDGLEIGEHLCDAPKFEPRFFQPGHCNRLRLPEESIDVVVNLFEYSGRGRCSRPGYPGRKQVALDRQCIWRGITVDL